MFRVEETSIGTGADLVDDIRFEIAVDCSWYVFAVTSLREESAESLIRLSSLSLFSQISIRLDAMLEAVKLPARVCNLATGLADVDRDDFSHVGGVDGMDN
jgi:hypothetical protein